MTSNIIINGNIYPTTCGAETAYPYGSQTYTPGLSGVHVARSLVFCAVFCRSLLSIFRLVIILSVLLITPLVSSIFSN